MYAYRKSVAFEGEEREKFRQRAYFLVGIILHMIEDMGVPAHAHKIYHQGNATEFDNFEFMSLSTWKPSLNLSGGMVVPRLILHMIIPGDTTNSARSGRWKTLPITLIATASPRRGRSLTRRSGTSCKTGRAAPRKSAQWALESAVRAFQND